MPVIIWSSIWLLIVAMGPKGNAMSAGCAFMALSIAGWIYGVDKMKGWKSHGKK